MAANFAACLVGLAIFAGGPGVSPSRPASSASAPVAAQAPAAGLDAVLTSMDNAAAGFHSAQANFKWDQFESAVSEHDVQSGVIYFRRARGGTEMMAHITDPKNAEKFVLYSGDSVKLFEPKLNRLTQYSTANHKDTFETFLLLGFGGRGHDLQKSFDVTLDGSEPEDGVTTQRLLLVPKTQKVKNVFDKIYLWIDPARGVSLRQKLIEPQSGNYRDAVYSDIQLNKPISDDVFKLNTNSKTEHVKPQG